ncbi:hypothetical protein [Aquimarina sp. AU58]|uniref:hypothetical protein n=1 Tax=Aquimarina sp. AU58 TaxID=1874112 RepID=UPI000D649869|nr:hypothetical protein [Aquimarina sp. AU58]
MVKQAGYVDKVTGKAGSLTEASNEEPDTTVTAKFASGIERTEGSAILHSTKDSTATMNKNEVVNFNKQSELSIKKQQQIVDKILDN